MSDIRVDAARDQHVAIPPLSCDVVREAVLCSQLPGLTKRLAEYNARQPRPFYPRSHGRRLRRQSATWSERSESNATASVSRRCAFRLGVSRSSRKCSHAANSMAAAYGLLTRKPGGEAARSGQVESGEKRAVSAHASLLVTHCASRARVACKLQKRQILTSGRRLGQPRRDARLLPCHLCSARAPNNIARAMTLANMMYEAHVSRHPVPRVAQHLKRVFFWRGRLWSDVVIPSDERRRADHDTFEAPRVQPEPHATIIQQIEL